MNGSGCKNCPVNHCETMNYRGSTCAAQRAKFGLGDPQTNADRIRAMSDEELAEYFAEIGNDASNGISYSENPEEWLEWLKQPAEEETQPDCTYNKNGHCIGQKMMPECDPKNCDRRIER